MFANEEAAVKALQRYGYYNIINGYKDPYTYISDESEEECYKNGTTFEQVYALYTLDRNLRNIVMNTMLEAEDMLKTATAHTIAEEFTAEESKYLSKSNYRQGKKINNSGDYSIDPLFNKFNKIRNDNSEPVKHAREEYNNVPPWILLKEASFGNIVNFIKLQKGPQKKPELFLLFMISLNQLFGRKKLVELYLWILYMYV